MVSQHSITTRTTRRMHASARGSHQRVIRLASNSQERHHIALHPICPSYTRNRRREGVGPPLTPHHAPGTMHPAPCTSQWAIRTLLKAPCTMHHAPCTTHRAPRTMHHAPCTTHHAPRTMHRAPRTTHHAPRTTHHAPHTTHHAPRTTLCADGPPLHRPVRRHASDHARVAALGAARHARRVRPHSRCQL